MKLKTYVGRDPQEAMAQVKKDLGPEAVILSTQSRRYPRSPSRSPQLRQVEVTAAVNQSSALDSFDDFQLWSPGVVDTRWASQDLKEELEEMKALLKQWLGEYGPPSWLAPHEELTKLFRAMTRAGISEQILRRWLEKVRKLLTDEHQGSSKNLREWSLRQLLHAVAVVNPWKLPVKGPRRWTLLGSTGVGKTTTIAKLAIQAAFMKKKRVGLISMDNGRLGGQEQLAAYARISGLPLVTAQNRRELAEALDQMINLEFILIDTPGRNPADAAMAQELHQLFGELPGLEHHLVLSATATEDNLADTLQGFNVLPITSCIMTKTDEARDIVGVFNQLSRKKLALSYLTMGQRVPEDLEMVTYRLLAGLLLKPHDGNDVWGRP